MAGGLDSFDTRPIYGRIYTASSITYDSERGLVQGGSSPGFWGGVWSLTCCKHDMRKAKYFSYFREIEAGMLRPTKPLFVFTAAAVTGSDAPPGADRRRWLASVALVTHAFETMEDYGRFLFDQQDNAWRDRFTALGPERGSEWGRNYGDCHATLEDDEVLEADAPYHSHDHVSSSGTTSCGCNTRINPEYGHVYQEDKDPDRLKIVSTDGHWLSWSDPRFYYANRTSRDRFGHGRGTKAFDPKSDFQDGTILGEIQERKP